MSSTGDESPGKAGVAETLRERRSRSFAWTRTDTYCLAAITAIAGALRWIRVTVPKGLIFDELYYAGDACLYVNPASFCAAEEAYPEGNVGELTIVHPPLAKWLIAAGIRAFGFNEFGWRIGPVIAGTATVALLYLLARRILRSTMGATVASSVLAIDFLHLTMSRIATLDIFTTLFTVVAFLFWAYDRDSLQTDHPPGKTRLLQRPWLLAAGAAAGAAIATKWSGAFAYLALIALTLGTAIRARRARGMRGAIASTIREEGGSLLVSLFIVPFLVYAASYIGRIDNPVIAAPWDPNSWVRGFLGAQRFILDYHLGLEGVQPYQSPAWSWPLLKRPMWIYLDVSGNTYREVLAVGSPLVWWSGLVAMAYVGLAWWRRRGKSAWPEMLIMVGFLATYAVWVLLTGARSFVFLYYFIAAVPFLALALGYAAVRLARSRWGRVGIGVFLAGSLGAFVFFYPILTALPLSKDAWRSRILFRDCNRIYTVFFPTDPLADEAGQSTRTNAVDGRVDNGATLFIKGLPSYAPPPDGWCWV